MTKSIITPRELRNLLRYEPETGKLFWRARTSDQFQNGKYSAERKCKMWNARHTAKEALTAISHGYHHGTIWGIDYRAHRVIFAIMTGAWPVADIDHENHTRNDNRWGNLREATRTENCQNSSLNKNNTSGFNGVFWLKREQKWRAVIAAGGKKIYLGVFADKALAITARSAANIEYGYHTNHGVEPT